MIQEVFSSLMSLSGFWISEVGELLGPLLQDQFDQFRAAGGPNLNLYPVEILDLCRPSALLGVVPSFVTLNRFHVLIK